MKARGFESLPANAVPPLLRRAAAHGALLACGAVLAGPASAQLPQLPQLPVPTVKVPEIPVTIPDPLTVIPRVIEQRTPPAEQRAREHLDRVRRHPDALDVDLGGNLVVRDEIVAFLPSSAMLESVRAHGYRVLRESSADPPIAVLRPRGNESALAGLRRLRELFPDGLFDLNHIYGPSGEAGATAPPAGPGPAAPATAAGPARRIGLIDGGVEEGTEALRTVRVHRQGCRGRKIASAHGTAVASIMVGRSGHFSGAAPGLELYAADVYCDEPTGGSVDAIVTAFVWLAGRRVPVINVSLVGPPNGVLEKIVRGMIERGHHVVAAVGNEGPAAPPLYPAAYAGVIAVTAVDRSLRVLPEATRGPHVRFAAPGANMAAARVPEGYTEVRGTSFAAPVVAGLLALLIDDVGPAAARQALLRLVGMASDIGPPGRDPIYGHGLVGWSVRVDPANLNLTDASRPSTSRSKAVR